MPRSEPSPRTSPDHIDPSVPASGDGCVECLSSDGWWFHLRRCALCGHVGCCDSSPGQHATAHYRTTGHRVIVSYEPEEDWGYDFTTEQMLSGVRLQPPESHPVDQPSPGPESAVPADWEAHLHR